MPWEVTSAQAQLQWSAGEKLPLGSLQLQAELVACSGDTCFCLKGQLAGSCGYSDGYPRDIFPKVNVAEPVASKNTAHSICPQW